MELIDIGCNLGHDSFDADREQVIEHARAAGVVQMVVTGASEAGSLRAVEVAEGHPGVLFATAGVHPHHAVDYCAETESVLAELHRSETVIAAGECGLDYFRDFSPRPTQRRAFERQLELAVDCGKPVFYTSAMPTTNFSPFCASSGPGWPARWCTVYGYARSAGCLPGARLSHRHHWLDLRRTPRAAPQGIRRTHSGRTVDGRDRRALSQAAQPHAEDQDPAKRTAVAAMDCRHPGRLPRRLASAAGRRDHPLRAPLFGI